MEILEEMHKAWVWEIIAPVFVVLFFFLLLYIYFFGRPFPQIQDDVPTYWEHHNRDVHLGLERWSEDYFDDTFPVPLESRDAVQELMRECNSLNSLNSRHTFRICRVVRHENSKLWHRYCGQLRRIAKARGQREFVGRGPPTTLEYLRDLDEDENFSQFNADACETYLWYGTEPDRALRLLHDGFGANPHKAELDRLEFFEDTSRADRDASSGKGLYKDCYSMLLCRVVLGSQQLIQLGTEEEASTSSSSEDAQAQKCDRINFDSSVTEDHGFARIFAPFDHAQVYPEYAIVYERCTPEELRAAESSRYLAMSPSSVTASFRYRGPKYWKNSQNPEQFAEMHPVVKFKPRIQAMMSDTWQVKFTRDRRNVHGMPIPRGDPNGDMPCGVRVLKTMRVENSTMWQRYDRTKEHIRTRRGICTPITRHPANTLESLGEREQRRLSPDVNECYLWHGSSPQAVISIAELGFNLDFSGKNVGNMFGKGAYFAECASKADEYAKDDPDGHYQGFFAMLLCRVVLGEIQTVTIADYQAHTRTGPGKPFDSTVGDREEAVGTFREFVVPSTDQVYPEYAIIYERVYRRERIR